jgi:hypothetical protein
MRDLRYRAGLVLVGLSAAGVVACAGILGIEDRGLDPQADASTGEGGNGGSCPDPCTMATGLNHPFLMTSDANNVYWTEFGDALGAGNGQVRACPVTGCGSAGPMAYAVGLTNPRGIAVDAQNVYWGTSSSSAVTGAIWTCPIAGCTGSPQQLVPAGVPFGVAVDGTYVYWVDNDSGAVHRVAKAGGGSDIVLYDAGSALTAEPEQCVVDSTSVFFTDYSGDLYRLPVGGGEPTTMVSWGNGGGWPVAIDSTYAYYGSPGQVARVAKNSTAIDGGTPVATGIPDPNGLAIDPATGDVYWSNFGAVGGKDGTVGKAASDGTSSSVLRASLATPEAVTVSGNNVYWLSNGTDDGTGSGGTLPSTGALVRNAK